jgi:hypothetical protein
MIGLIGYRYNIKKQQKTQLHQFVEDEEHFMISCKKKLEHTSELITVS